MKILKTKRLFGGFRKYLAGKYRVHSELSLHDPGKINLCGGKNKECRPKQDTPVSLRAQNPAATLVGRKTLKGVRRGAGSFS